MTDRPDVEAIARKIARQHDLDPDDARLGFPAWQAPWILEAATMQADQAIATPLERARLEVIKVARQWRRAVHHHGGREDERLQGQCLLIALDELDQAEAESRKNSRTMADEFPKRQGAGGDTSAPASTIDSVPSCGQENGTF